MSGLVLHLAASHGPHPGAVGEQELLTEREGLCWGQEEVEAVGEGGGGKSRWLSGMGILRGLSTA